MCGIVGFTGKDKQAAPVLLDGLSKLEYRGYDSAGIAVRDENGKTRVVKTKGQLRFLYEKTAGGSAVRGTCGVGHTRWATHGEPTENNAHPHISDDYNVVGVHNGIIENYKELREKLLRKGYTFYSQTDTEILIKLVDYYYKKYNIGPIDAINKTLVRVRGSYALVVMFKDYPGEIYAARKDSPMIVGQNEDGAYVASDVPAILKYTRSVHYVANNQMTRLTPDSVEFYDLNGDLVPNEPVEIRWDAEAAEKNGYEHFMIKEIHEQPKAVRDTISSVVKTEPELHLDLSDCGITGEIARDISQICVVACGSAYHVGCAAQYVIEDLAKVPVRVELASEFRYREMLLDSHALVIAISQSGETADTREALLAARAGGIRTLAIVNVIGSSIAREADHVFYTLAGPEIAVATTKAYSAQLAAVYMLAIQLAWCRGKLDDDGYKKLITELQTIPDKIERVFQDKGRIQWFASKMAHVHDAFFIGRGMDYAVSLEGSLKLKEISYIHSEAFAAGELKHGTISLVEQGTHFISILTQKHLFEKTVSNMVEVKSRGAYLVAVTSYGHYEAEDVADFVIYVPETDEHFAASLAVIPLQLLSYYVSISRGLDVDKPRNLAKSVTVE